jgi:TetR/AcrR family tetracycline transcriptional repressor
MRDYWAQLPADRFPNVTALADITFVADNDDLFEFGLGLLVRGLSAYRDAPASLPH